MQVNMHDAKTHLSVSVRESPYPKFAASHLDCVQRLQYRRLAVDQRRG